MSRFRLLFLSLGLVAVSPWVHLPVSPQAQTDSLPGAGLTGIVQSQGGKPLEGIAVSAKAEGSTITTTVYTNEGGEYRFPPLLDGRYRMSAQAIGFENTQAWQVVSFGKKIERDFTLKPYAEEWRQLSSAEWLDSLPNATAEDRRMKKVMLYNCSTCHDSGFVLEKRFDAAGWEIIINKMKKISGWWDPPNGPGCCGGGHVEGEVPGTGGQFEKTMVDENGKPIGAQRRVMEFYANDILAYLTRVRGPQSPPIQERPFPRPTGDAADIVVTEYDLPTRDDRTLGRLDPKSGHVTQFTLGNDGSTQRDDSPEYNTNEYRNGSDWTVGVRSQYEDNGTHDLQVGQDGYVYFGISLGMVKDKQGNIWGGQDSMLKFDPKTEKFTTYSRPKEIREDGAYNAGRDIDSKGNLYGAVTQGVEKMTPAGEYTMYKAKSPLGRVYGLSVDAEDNVWFNQVAIDKIGYIDGRTGEVGEVSLPPLDEEISAIDRKVGRGYNMNHPLYTRGPRRGGADKNGDAVYVNQFFAGRIAEIDIHTKKITDYKLPGGFRYGAPYYSVVDKNHMVWFAMANADYIGKLNPAKGQFTFYPLPTRGSNTRHLDLDQSRDMPEVWIPDDGANKIARMQFRTHAANR